MSYIHYLVSHFYRKFLLVGIIAIAFSVISYGKVSSNSVKNSNENVAGTTTTNLTPEEEKEAYEALERVRARIEKEEQEKLKAQQEIAEAQNQVEAQTETVTEQTTNENTSQNQVFVETAAPRMTPEEEKEAYEALERVRARILKEDEERAELLKAAAEQQVQ